MKDEEELKKLGSIIKSAREAKGLSTRKFATSIGKDHPSIVRVETGKVNPSYLFLLEVCEGLDMSLSDLLSQD